MTFFLRFCLLVMVQVLLRPVAGAAVAASDLQLADLLDSALARGAPDAELATPFTSSSWLAALPSVGLSYLGSDEREGTDETEISLNLPVKSARGRRFDRQIAELSARAGESRTRLRRLFYSGLVREALWSLELATARERFTGRKIALLEQFEGRQEALVAAQAASEYGLLAIRRERLQAQIEQQEQLRERDRWQRRYRQLTGLRNPPDDIEEAEPPPRLEYGLHPELEMLELDWQLRKSLLAAGSQDSAPWHLSLMAKHLDSPQFEENQYGVAVEVPLSFLDMDSEANLGEWREAAQQYWMDRDTLLAGLDERWQRLVSEADFLRQKQALLEEAVATGERLARQIDQLRTSSEVGEEMWLRRTMEALDTRAEEAINRLLIGQNRAMRRQAAGMPL
jgi:hypothetical protein